MSVRTSLIVYTNFLAMLDEKSGNIMMIIIGSKTGTSNVLQRKVRANSQAALTSN